jgi:hypothetical protein
MKARVSLLLGACSAILCSTTALAQSSYSATELASGYYFTSMNNSGQLVGMDSSLNYVYTDANGLSLHTLATPDGFIATQGTLNPTINNLGQIAGAYANLDYTIVQGFYTTTSGAVVSTSANGQPLPAINALNDQGQMIGVNFANGNAGSALTSQGGASWQAIRALNNNLGGNPYAVTGINNQGQMTGVSQNSTGDVNSFFASADGSSVIEPINSLVGATERYQYVVSKMLNDKGQLAGTYADADGNYHVYLTGPNGTGVTTLDGLSVALGVNNAGQIAGYGNDGNGHSVAMITGDNGQGMVDLNTLYGLQDDSFTMAQGINDAGQVLVYTANGKEYLLTPVPEASTSALMLLGLCGLGLARRRKH